ncbi:TPA: radical SAM protein [Burkholderia vietnamiensis]|nr:radical SAM protein [Burkholderia vietnamiensis]
MFNTGLAQGIANILPPGSQCICVVEEAPVKSPPSKVSLLTLEFEAKTVVDALISEINKRSSRDIEGVLVIGHDLKTGELAVCCARELQLWFGRGTPVKSAIVSHMDYMEYARRKGQALPDVIRKSQMQHALVASADHAFAVGPLLANGFQSARSGRNDRVIALTPGSSNIRSEPENKNSLRFYIAGRLGLEDDQIKNGVLSVRAVIAAYREMKRSRQVGRWATRGHFYACGADRAKDAELLDLLRKEAQEADAFVIEAMPFADDQEEMHRHLARSDVALMPSWHEGFGLSGWEALCAGVPLVCSSQSGLALLIDQLRHALPDADFRSIEPVQLAGGAPAGMPTPHDTSALSEAIKRIVENYSEKKKAALSLALRIKRHFTWDRCAAELVAQVNWPWANSGDWFQRQQIAQRAAESSDGTSGAAVVLEALEACQTGNVEREWTLVCSALNFFSDVGSSAGIRERQTLTKDLLTVGAAISETLERKDEAEKLPIVDTVFLDLCWRYMAAASRLAKTFSEFTALFRPAMLDGIWGDGFLRREMLFYTCRFAEDFDGRSEDLARHFLEPLAQHISDDRSLRIRLARLGVVYPNIRRVIDGKGNSDFDAEILRCKEALEKPFDLSQLLEQSADIAPTALALSSLKPDTACQSIDQPIGFVKRLDPTNSATKTWRGDKRLAAAMITTSVSSTRVLTVLEAMAQDEEEAIRWAALDLAFSPILRARLEASSSADRSVCSKLGMIVDSAVIFGGAHPWLAREFLNHYRDEHTSSYDGPRHITKFTLIDFPQSRLLFGPPVEPCDSVLSRPMHPEVEDARARASETVKRVLLVLPPISFGSVPGCAASTTSTPPLGLGLLGSHLSQQGHDVQLADCHRFPDFANLVIDRSKTFDLIGFNAVFSTVRSTRQMLSRIRGATQRPILVIGGPVANLDGWRFSGSDDSDRRNWDFVISQDAVGNLQRLVDSLKTPRPWPDGNGLHPNPDSTIVAFRDVEPEPHGVLEGDDESPPDIAWMKIRLDRRLYKGPDGQYEPGRTRNVGSPVHEAHIVMSRGCDWNCSFCTERRKLSKGERRRDVDSVLDEVRQLAKKYENLRIQFIDDNLLPQIASPFNASRVRTEEGVAWAERFLKGLQHIRDERFGSLTWRGIFRLEDFAAYEAKGEPDGFLRVLSEAGCNMLAFGVESGNADTRHSLKAGGREFSNDVIANLFRRLRSAGIFTKAYFILGGPKETAISTEETISFAVNSGASLAYFALYKDFVPAQRELSKDRGLGNASTTRLLDYEQLMSTWDSAFSARIRREPIISDPGLSSPPVASEYQSYKKLAGMGFRFSDLVKYNDYHAKDGPSGEVLKNVTWNRPDEFFALVEKAYRSFYLRQEFVADFKKLVAAGY